MSATEDRILGDAEALANIQGEYPPVEADFEAAEREVRAWYRQTSEPFFPEED